MNETAVGLGAGGSLIGVYTERADVGSGDAPAVILLNAGITHRSGPFRIHVEVARRLASRGYPCLRLDLAGIGDSAGRKNDKVSEQEGTLADARWAMEYLESQAGATRFVLFGLCSGADDSHQIALKDSRVAGYIALDGFAYPSSLRLALRQFGRLAGHPRHVWQRAIARSRSSRVASAVLGPAPLPAAESPREVRFQAFQRDFPPQKQVAAEIENLLDRGVQPLYVYSGGYKLYNTARQFYDDFPNVRQNPRVEVEYFRDADHTYILLADRERLIERVEAWLTSRFPPCGRTAFQPALTATGPSELCLPAIGAANRPE